MADNNVMIPVMGSPFGSQSGSAVAYDTDTIAWWNAVIANGNNVSASRLSIVNTFIVAEKNAGLWTLTDDYWGFFAENSIQGLTSLKQRRLAVAVNTPTFTTDRGYDTNGTTSYVNLVFVPSTDALSMTVNSTHAEIYERSNVSANANAMGVGSTSARAFSVVPRNVGNANGAANSNSGTFTLPAADSRGLTQFGRNGSLVTDLYGAKNGVDMTRTVNPTLVGTPLPAHNFVVGAFNNAGSIISLRASSYGYASVGAALSGAQRLARYTNVQAWATSVGANV